MTALEFIHKKDIENGSCAWTESDDTLSIALDEYVALKLAEGQKPPTNKQSTPLCQKCSKSSGCIHKFDSCYFCTWFCG